MAPLQHFRFLDLPTELRWNAYRCLGIRTQHVKVPLFTGSKLDPCPYVILVLETLPTAILSTSHQLAQDALTILGPMMYRILSTPPRIIVPMSMLSLTSPRSIEMMILVALHISVLRAEKRHERGPEYIKNGLVHIRSYLDGEVLGQNLGLNRKLVYQFMRHADLYRTRAFGSEPWQKFAPLVTPARNSNQRDAEIVIAGFRRIDCVRNAAAGEFLWMSQAKILLQCFLSSSGIDVFIVDACAEGYADREESLIRRKSLAEGMMKLDKFAEDWYKVHRNILRSSVRTLDSAAWNENWVEGERC
jgi:hypothetical protein